MLLESIRTTTGWLYKLSYSLMVFAALVPAKSCVEWNYWRILFFCSSVWFFYLHFYVSSWRVFYTHAYARIFHCNENKDFSYFFQPNLLKSSSYVWALSVISLGGPIELLRFLKKEKKKRVFTVVLPGKIKLGILGKKNPPRMVVVAMPPTIPKRRRIFTHFLGVRRPLPTLFEHSINQTFPLSSVLTNSFWPLAIESNVFSNFSFLCWSFSMPVSDIKVVRTLKVIKIKVDWSQLRKFCWRFEDPAPPHKHWLLQSNSSDLYSFH